MNPETRSKLSIVSVAAGAMVAGELIFVLLGSALTASSSRPQAAMQRQPIVQAESIAQPSRR